MEYSISKTEIKRRLVAYIALVISLSIGMALAVFIWLPLATALYLIVPVILIFALSIWLFASFFKRYLDTKLILTDEYIERCSRLATQRLLLRDIEQIKVLYTSKNLIRDIIIIGHGQTMAIDGLDNFQQFRDNLMARIPQISAKESREFMDFDHLLFYPFLGLILGFALPYLVITWANSGASWLYYVVALYATFVGIFFIINHPLAKRYGNKKPFSDIIWGLVLIISGIIIFLIHQ